MICGHSWFSSVATAETLAMYNMRFISVVKNGSRGYPMEFLSKMEFTNRGEHVSMVSQNAFGKSQLMAVLWMDRERRYFICSCSMWYVGETIERTRWMKEGDVTSKL